MKDDKKNSCNDLFIGSPFFFSSSTREINVFFAVHPGNLFIQNNNKHPHKFDSYFCKNVYLLNFFYSTKFFSSIEKNYVEKK